MAEQASDDKYAGIDRRLVFIHQESRVWRVLAGVAVPTAALVVGLGNLPHGFLGGLATVAITLPAIGIGVWIWSLPIRFGCPHCGGLLSNKLRWECGYCGEEHPAPDLCLERSFLSRCSHCGSQPRAMRCIHCNRAVHFLAGGDDLGIAFVPDEPLPDLSPPVAAPVAESPAETDPLVAQLQKRLARWDALLKVEAEQRQLIQSRRDLSEEQKRQMIEDLEAAMEEARAADE
jgi:hypothetical protein